MTVITTKDIAACFNNTIKDFMDKGYIISPFTENGSYSHTKCHVDMINPKDNSHILRVWMPEDYYNFDRRYGFGINVTGVRVKKYLNGKGYNGDLSREQTLWPGEEYGEVVYEKLFYMFKEKKGKVYTDNIEEAKKYIELHDKRLDSRYYKCNNTKHDITRLPSSFIDKIMSRINSVRGFKRATAKCIKSVTSGKNYNGRFIAAIKYEFNNKSGIVNLR